MCDLKKQYGIVAQKKLEYLKENNTLNGMAHRASTANLKRTRKYAVDNSIKQLIIICEKELLTRHETWE